MPKQKEQKQKGWSRAVGARLAHYLMPYKGYLIAAFVSAVIGVVLSLLSPVLIGKAIDYIIGPRQVDFTEITKILSGLGAAIVTSALFQWFMTYCTNKVTFKTVRDLRNEAFAKLNEVPLKYIDTKAHGDIINSIVNDIDIVSDGLLQGFAQLFTGVVTIAGTLVIMMVLHFRIALVVVVLTPLSILVAGIITSRTHKKFSEQALLRGEMGAYIEEMIGNQKIVKAFSHEQKAQEVFDDVNGRLYTCGVMAQFYSALTNPCTRFVNGLVYAAVGIYGAIVCVGGGMTVGLLSSFLSYANQYTKPFNEISGVITELQNAFASAARVFALLDEAPEQSDEGLLDSVPGKGEVTLTNVKFSYTDEQQLITNFNLHVKPGQRIAIVGPTGCGKTTIINLLMRFYDVKGGSIQTDGIDIRKMTRKALRSQYNMVLQETWLFKGTVAENIAYGKEGATREEVMNAARAAHAHGFIKRLPKGYDTVISEDGGNISQGQKQLLCIARIMLQNPPMLILDEATSNIDTRTEIKVQKAFAKLMENKTSFVVAHRLSTIKESDCILRMRDGHIIEQGTHKELLKKGGFYADLYQSQFAR